jgi:iron complex outermembrane receptor protein
MKKVIGLQGTERLLLGCSIGALIALMPVAALAQTADEPAAAEEQAGVVEDPAETVAAGPIEEAGPPAQDIIVTGTRLSSGFTAPTPVSVVSQEQLNVRATGTIAETLFEIPAIRATTGQGANQRGTINAGQALLDLRGLGRQRTLTLINGRRIVGTSGDGSFDTNMVPSILVERTDVVTGGASAAYGSDAVAGVVNFVTNQRLDGITGKAQYGVSEAGDGQEYVLGLAMGKSFADDRLHIVIGGEYARGLGAADIYSRDWGRKDGALVSLTANRPAGTPAFLLTGNAQSAISPGGLITSCVQGATVLAGAACPVYGTTFNSAGTPVPFEFGSPVGSTTMVGGGNRGHWVDQYITLRQGYKRYAGMGTISYDLSENVTAKLELMGGSYQVESQSVFYVAPANSIRIGRDNPFLPDELAAQMDLSGLSEIRMARQNEDLGGIKPHNRSKFLQGSFGLEGNIFDDWKWDATVGYGDSKFTYRASDFLILPNYYAALYAVRDGSGNIVCGPTATNPMLANLTPAQRAVIQSGCVPFNPFGPKQSSDAAYDYIYGESARTDHFQRTDAAFNLSGSPFSTWAGPVSLAVGYEYRRDKLASTVPDDIEALSAASAFFATNFKEGGGAITVNEGYVEIGVPLLDEDSGLGVLDFNGAIRYADYSTSGGATTWKVGATYDPIPGVRFRGTVSRDIRAPNIPELFVPGVEGLSQVTRPDTGVSGQTRTQSVPNPNLQPEKADTYTFGVVLQPESFLRGLRFSADYFDITINDVITSVPTQEVLRRRFPATGQGDTSFDPFIVFDNSALGFSLLGSPLLNLNTQKTSGVDFELAYRLPDFGIGQFTLGANATWTRRLETINDAGSSLGQLAGVSTGVPKWRATANLAYDSGRLNTVLTARYTSSFKLRHDLLDPSDDGYDPASALSINDNRLPASVYFSLSTNVRLTEEKGGPTLFLVVDNLFDKDPPLGSYLALQAVGGANPYDVLGRSFRVGFRFKY